MGIQHDGRTRVDLLYPESNNKPGSAACIAAKYKHVLLGCQAAGLTQCPARSCPPQPEAVLLVEASFQTCPSSSCAPAHARPWRMHTPRAHSQPSQHVERGHVGTDLHVPVVTFGICPTMKSTVATMHALSTPHPFCHVLTPTSLPSRQRQKNATHPHESPQPS
jgi:hypothetical protein